MSPWAIGALAWLAAIIILAPVIGRWLRRSREAAEQAPAPANRPSAGAGPHPGAGAEGPPVPAPAPGPADHLTLGRRRVTIRVYERGICIWDATGTHIATIETRTRDWDGWLRKITQP